jgi:hypothetical protein
MRILVFSWLITLAAVSLSQACRMRAEYAGTTAPTNGNYALQSQARPADILEPEAIRVAESFVARQGYTESLPSDVKSVVYEASDPPDRERALRLRSNSLEPNAYAAKMLKEPVGWMVIFQYNRTNSHLRSVVPNFDEYIETWGRAVLMDLNGDNVRLAHQDVKLGPN